jgi:hypothetical protein
MRGLLGSLIGDPKRPNPAAARYALMRGAGTETHGWPDVHNRLKADMINAEKFQKWV